VDLAALEINLVTGTFWISLVSFLLFLTSVVTKKDSGKSQITSQLGFVAMILVSLTSTGALVAKGILTGHVPWSNFYESMILMTALDAVLFLFIYKAYKHDLLGVIMSPAIVILVGIASILPKNFRGNEPLVPALQSYWIKIHTTSMIVSYSVFLLATTTAIAYLIMFALTNRSKYLTTDEESRKIKRMSLASTGPSLGESDMSIVANPTIDETKESSLVSSGKIKFDTERMHAENPHLAFFDDITYRMVLLGFPILAFGIITGAMWANHAWGTYWSWDPKETASLMTWMFYAAYIHTRVSMNLKGKTSAILAVVGFAAVIFTYYGVNYLPGLHSYGFAT